MHRPDSSPDLSRAARLAAHGAAATSLALLGDHALRARVDAAASLGSGIGGTSVLLDVDGTPVFVKQVRLTALERRPEHVHSTANLFGLPAFCHYGVGAVGSPGFGAWREPAAHTMTANWVISGAYEGFPLLHHWRVLPSPRQPLPDELADVEGAVAHWGGGTGIRRRIEELRDSSASLLLFLEYVPENLHDWLDRRIAAGGDAAGPACAMADRELAAGLSFMNARGLLHCDAHFRNILTDGRRLYFTDFGLALSSRFELAPPEAHFADRHRAYDRAYAATHFVNWLAAAHFGYGPREREQFVRACARGPLPPGTPAALADVLTRHGPVAEVMGDFFRRFRQDSRTTPFPREAIDRAAGVGGGR